MTQLFFRIAHVSRDGRDLAILSSRDRLLLIRDFERVCRGEVSLADAGQVLRLFPGDRCCYLAFEHGRVCVATVRCSIHDSTLLVLTYALPPFLWFLFFSFRSFMVFTSSTSTEALPLTQQRPCSCDLTSHLRLVHISRSAACSSPTVAFTFHGKTRDVGTFRCSKTAKIGQSPHHPGPHPQPNHLLKHGHGWTPNLVGSMPFSHVAIAGDVSPTHKIILCLDFQIHRRASL